MLTVCQTPPTDHLGASRDISEHLVTIISHVSPTRASGSQLGMQKTPGIPGVSLCARYWDRTSDLFRVREARYRCANRAREGY